MSDASQAKEADLMFGATIRDALTTMEAEGYTGSFRVAGANAVECLECHAVTEPERLRLELMCRIEGVSDPADEEFVAGLLCPQCRAKGTLILTYGPNASAEDAEVLTHLKDRRFGRDEPSA